MLAQFFPSNKAFFFLVPSRAVQGPAISGYKGNAPLKDILMRRSVPLVFTFLLVVSIAFACLTVGNDVWHQSIRRMREATLMQDLSIMRQGIDNFTKDREVPPQSLQELVDLK